MKIDREQWVRISALLDEALDLDAAEREAWLHRLSGEAAGLREPLRALLAQRAHIETDEFLKAPDFAAAVRQESARQQIDAIRVGQRVGPYELDRELGRGGMGSVWLAHRADGAYRRDVALKLPHVIWGGNLPQRLVRERDILASLQHDNIARFFDAGIDAAGRPFLAMEYIAGLPIDEYCRQREVSLPDRLRLVVGVAKAVAHAHSKLIVHRDLKPANILVTAEGAVRLLDFGVATLLDPDGDRGTASTQFTGRALTVDYASPEQIRGEEIGTGTDVYSLGVVTFELLTGTRPYRLKRGTAAELEQAIAEVDPPPASQVAASAIQRRLLRGDLDAIVQKALKKNPGERYATADSFAQDLEAYLAGEPVTARGDSASYRLRKFIGRHKLGIGMAAALLLAVSAGVAAVLVQSRQTALQAARAEATKNFLVDIFKASDPRLDSDMPRGQITARQLLDRGGAEIEKRFAQAPETAIELLGTIADIDHELGDDEHYLLLNERKIELARQHLGALSDPVLDGSVKMAANACRNYDWQKCQALLAAADDLLNRAGKNESTTRALWWQAESWRMRAQPHKEKERLEALEHMRSIYARVAPRDPGHVKALSELAGYYGEVLQSAQAIELYKEAIALNDTLDERNDADIQMLYSNMSVSYMDMGAYPQALDSMDRAAAIADRSVGRDFRTRWNPRSDKAELLFNSGNRAEADKEWEELEKIMPPAQDHDSDAELVRMDHGFALAIEGRPALGLPLVENALQTMQIRNAHPRFIIRAQRRAAEVYDRLGQIDKARAALRSYVDYVYQNFAPGSMLECYARERWGRFLFDHGDLAGAGEQFNTVLKTASAQASQAVILAWGGAARVALARRDIPAALTLSAQALELWGKRQGYYDVRSEPYLQRIRADALAGSGNVEEAQALEDRAFAASEQYDAPESPTRIHRKMLARVAAFNR